MKTVKMSMVTIMAVLAMVVFPQGDMQATPQQAGTNAQVDRDVTIQNSRVVTVQRFILATNQFLIPFVITKEDILVHSNELVRTVNLVVTLLLTEELCTALALVQFKQQTPSCLVNWVFAHS